jgi:hypothetical protein
MNDYSASILEKLIEEQNEKISAGHPYKLVARYHRVSSVGQATEGTISLQKQKTQAHFERELANDPTVKYVGEFNDDPYALESYDKHKEFWQMLELIKRKEINYLIVVDNDRIFRSSSREIRGRIADVFVRYKVTTVIPGATPRKWLKRDEIINSVTESISSQAKEELKKKLVDGQIKGTKKREVYATITYGYRISKEIRRFGSEKTDSAVARNRSVSKAVYTETVHPMEADVIRDMYDYFNNEPLSNLREIYVPPSLVHHPRTVSTLMRILNYQEGGIGNARLREEFVKYAKEQFKIDVPAVNDDGEPISERKINISSKWHRGTVEYILKNRTYTGTRYVIYDVEGKTISSEQFKLANIRKPYKRFHPKNANGEYLRGHLTYDEVRPEWIATTSIQIVPFEVFEKAQKKFGLLEKERKSTGGGVRHEGWLKSYVVCGVCKKPVEYRWNKDNKTETSTVYVRCKEKHFFGVHWGSIEESTFESVVKIFNKEYLANKKNILINNIKNQPVATDNRRKKQLMDEAIILERKKNEFQEALNLGKLSLEDYLAVIAANKTLVQKNIEALAALETVDSERNQTNTYLKEQIDKLNEFTKGPLDIYKDIKSYGSEVTSEMKLALLESIREFIKQIEVYPTTLNTDEIRQLYSDGQYDRIQTMLNESVFTMKALESILGTTRHHLMQKFYNYGNKTGGRPSVANPTVKVRYTFDIQEEDTKKSTSKSKGKKSKSDIKIAK